MSTHRMRTPLDPELVLPQYGAALRLERRHAEGRWLVLTPRDRLGPLTLDRRSVMAFAATVELALDPTGAATPGPPSRRDQDPGRG